MTEQLEQLALLDVPAPAKPLTARQQAVLDAVTRAGTDGLDTDQAGAILHGLKEGRWAHGPEERCVYCGRDGKHYLERLRELGHVRYRRARNGHPGAWISTDPSALKAKPAAAVTPLSEEEEFGF